MNKLFTLLLIAFSGVCFAQANHDTSVFHRLVIYNDANEIMVVKLKDTDIWVTPGFYQDSTRFIKAGLHDIAATYGMTISDPELKGIFSMRREVGESTEMLMRNIYSCKHLSGEVRFPENQSFTIGEIKWLPLQEALPLIPFESVRLFIKQIHDNPNAVWGGSIGAKRVDNEWKYETKEAFYPLFNPKKP
jgi:hypothetical protein